jgi:hypothetical protein
MVYNDSNAPATQATDTALQVPLLQVASAVPTLFPVHVPMHFDPLTVVSPQLKVAWGSVGFPVQAAVQDGRETLVSRCSGRSCTPNSTHTLHEPHDCPLTKPECGVFLILHCIFSLTCDSGSSVVLDSPT